jgi:hypothetical protein
MAHDFAVDSIPSRSPVHQLLAVVELKAMRATTTTTNRNTFSTSSLLLRCGGHKRRRCCDSCCGRRRQLRRRCARTLCLVPQHRTVSAARGRQRQSRDDGAAALYFISPPSLSSGRNGRKQRACFPLAPILRPKNTQRIDLHVSPVSFVASSSLQSCTCQSIVSPALFERAIEKKEVVALNCTIFPEGFVGFLLPTTERNHTSISLFFTSIYFKYSSLVDSTQATTNIENIDEGLGSIPGPVLVNTELVV